MNINGLLLFWAFIWVALIWRCFAVTSICREVAEGKTTKGALLFQFLQAGLFFFTAVSVLRMGTGDIFQIITAASLLFTAAWYAYSIAKAAIRVKKNG